jgi:hypothetical protein
MSEFGERWPSEWLRNRGLSEWAEYWSSLFDAGDGLYAVTNGTQMEEQSWNGAALR